MIPPDRLLFVAVILGNAVAFAGIDPAARAVSAACAVALLASLQRLPQVPATHRLVGWTLAALALLQLTPLPIGVRSLAQPGFAEVMHSGWSPLSLAPWATLSSVSAWIIATALAVYAAHLATTRSGLPTLLILIAATGVLGAVLGVIAEGGNQNTMLLIRQIPHDNWYGAFADRSDFGLSMMLSVPAAAALFAAAWRRAPLRGLARQKAVISMLTAAVAMMICTGALIRSGAHGGAALLLVGLAVSLPLWRRRRTVDRLGTRLAVAAGIVLVITLVAWIQLPELEERTAALMEIDGMPGISRADVWRSTAASWLRAPIVGTGMGSFAYVITLDKPPTGTQPVERARNDWLEWLSTTGFLGLIPVGLGIAGFLSLLRPAFVRRLRSHFRYPLAGAAAALIVTALYALGTSGLQCPANQYLVATWVGVIWGVTARGSGQNPHTGEQADANEAATSSTSSHRRKTT